MSKENPCNESVHNVTICDRAGVIIHSDTIDLAPDEECFTDVFDVEGPLKVTVLTKGGIPDVAYRKDNFDSYDIDWVDISCSGKETQKTQER